jgi:hypothetical protein
MSWPILYDLVFSKRIVIRTMGVLVLVLLESLFLTASEGINSHCHLPDLHQAKKLYISIHYLINDSASPPSRFASGIAFYAAFPFSHLGDYPGAITWASVWGFSWDGKGIEFATTRSYWSTTNSESGIFPI